MPNEGKEEGERVEVDVRLAVLGEGLDLCGLHPGATDPDCAFHDDCRTHSENRSRWQIGNFVGPTWQQLLDRLLQNLHERDDHDYREDEDADRFKTPSANWEFLLELGETPAHQLVRCPDYDCAEQIECRVDERCDEGEGGGCEEEEVGWCMG